MGLSRQEYWSGLPFLSPGFLPKPGIKSASPTWQADHLPLSHLVSHKSLLLLFSFLVVSDSLQLCGLQHARLPCTSPSPGACSNSCPLSQWCHPTISSSFIPFSSCPQSFPASGSFLMSALCIRWPKDWSFNFSISPSNEYPGLSSFRMNWLDLLAVQRTLKSLPQHHSLKAS